MKPAVTKNVIRNRSRLYQQGDNMEILVTGGAGFIGSHTVETLLARGERVIALDNFNTYYDPERKHRNVAPFMSNPNFRLVHADLRDRVTLEHLFTTEPIRRI